MANRQMFKDLQDEEGIPADAAIDRRATYGLRRELDIEASQTKDVLDGKEDDDRSEMEVSNKHPDKKERSESLELVRPSVKCGGSVKCPEEVGKVWGSIGELEEGLVRKLSTESPNDAISSVSAEENDAIKQSQNTEQSEQAINDPSTINSLLLATTVEAQERAIIVAKVDALQQSMNDVKAIVVSSFGDLQMAVAGGKKEVASLVSKADSSIQSHEDVKSEVNSIKQSLSSLQNDFNKSREEMKGEVHQMKETTEEVKGGMNSVKYVLDVLQDDFKKSHEDMKVIVNAMRQSIEHLSGELAKQTSTAELQTPSQSVKEDGATVIPTFPTPDKETDRRDCIDAMMTKTKVFPSNDEKKSKMRKLYGRFYDRDQTLSTILQFLRYQAIEVHVDFEREDIERLKSKFRDHDGRELGGDGIRSFADFEEKRVYVIGRLNSDVNVIGYLARALSQLSVFLAYENRGLPYSERGDEENKDTYQDILEEVQWKANNGEELDVFIKGPLDQRTRMGQEIYLHAAVPHNIAYEGPSGGRSLLERQVESLLKYFEDHVVAKLRAETMKAIARERSALQ